MFSDHLLPFAGKLVSPRLGVFDAIGLLSLRAFLLDDCLLSLLVVVVVVVPPAGGGGDDDDDDDGKGVTGIV